jgi:hypothetical protein
LAFAALRIASEDSRHEEEKQNSQTGVLVHREGERPFDFDLETELLAQLSDQSVGRGFAVIHLTARKLPQAGHVAAFGTLGEENAPRWITDHRGDDGERAKGLGGRLHSSDGIRDSIASQCRMPA